MRYLDSLVGLFVLYLAQAVFASTKFDNSSSPLCRSLQEQRVTDAEYHSSVASWLQTRLDGFHDHYGSDSNTSFQDNLTVTYAPDVAQSIARCRGEHLCSVVSCRFISSEFNLTDQRNAFLALELYSNINERELVYRSAANDAFAGLNAGLVSMMSQFTDIANWKQHQEEVHFKQKFWMQIGSTGAMLAAAVAVPFTGGAALPAMMAAKMIPAMAEGAVSLIKETVGAAVNFVVGTYIGVRGIGELTMNLAKPDEARQQTQEILSKLLMVYHQMSEETISHNLELLYKGQKDSKDWNIVEYARAGNYTAVDRTIKTDIHFRKLWAAGIIGALWHLERTYIVWSDAPDGCASDTRGPAHLKVCLDDYPKAVFYSYFIERVRETTAHQALVQGPPGNKLLQEYGLTLKDVVEASVEHYKKFKFDNFDFNQKDAFNQWASPDMITKGGNYRGLFTSPVCRNPGGEAISSVNLEKGRNYPCMCGEYSWDTGPSSPANDETEGFLRATSLGNSEDMKRRCDHKQNCKENHDITWGFTKIKHPWVHCGHDKNRPRSCDHPNHNGVDQNENC